MKTMTMDELHTHLKAAKFNPLKGELLLDVRTKDEFDEGHIAHSINIPHEEVEDHISTLKKYHTIYVYCRAGGRAKHASLLLKNQGLGDQIICVGTSGMMDWVEADYPLAKD